MSTRQGDEYERRAAAAPKMTDAEAAELVDLAQQGNLLARVALMNSHRRIVARLRERYRRGDRTSDELTRLGESGLAIAINKFDVAKGFSFTTYATWRIGQAIRTDRGGGGGSAGVHVPRTPRPSSGSGAAAFQVDPDLRIGRYPSRH